MELEDRLILVQDGLLARADVADLGQVVRVGVHELSGDEIVRLQRTTGGEEPELIADDRSTDAGIEVAVLFDLARRGQPALLNVAVGVVVGRPAASRVAAEDRSAELVAAIARDEVDADAARGRLRVNRRDVDGELLRSSRIRDRAAAPATADAGTERHAVDHHALVVGTAAVGRQRRHFCDDSAADVTCAEALGDARNQYTQRERIS